MAVECCLDCKEPVHTDRRCYYHAKQARGFFRPPTPAVPTKQERRGGQHRAKGELSADDSRHGTYTGYQYWHCRCDPCRDAGSEYNRKRKMRDTK